MKKIMSTILCVAIMLSFIITSSASTAKTVNSIKQISKDKITLKIVVPDVSPLTGDYAQMKVFQDYEKKTNVHAEWQYVPVDAVKDKVPLIFASGDLPDAFYGPIFANWLPGRDFEYGTEGMLIPLNKIVNSSMPNLKKRMNENPLLAKQMTAPDGKIYSLPNYYNARPNTVNPYKWFIRNDMLAKTGKKMPTTPNELYELLKAIKSADGSKIPLSMILKSGQNGTVDIINLSGSWGVINNTQVNSGIVSFGFMNSGFKDALKFWNKLYKDGLLDKEIYTQDFKLLQSKGGNGQLAAFVGDYNVPGSESFIKDYTPIPPLSGSTGKKLWNVTIPMATPAFSITNVNKYPEVTARWLDYNYSDEGTTYMRAGIEGVTWKKSAQGAIQYLTSPDGKKNAWEWLCWTTPCPFAPSYQTRTTFTEDLPSEEKLQDKYADTIYNPFGPKQTYNIFYYKKEYMDQITPIKTSMDPYVEQMKAKFITGAVDIDSGWSNYINTLKKMGSNQLLKIYQKVYDETYKK